MDNLHNPARVPIYLEAKNKDDLIKLMYETNLINGKSYNYQPPIKDGKRWVVWFYVDINLHNKVGDE